MAENSMVTGIATLCRQTVKVIRRQRVVRTPATSIARLQSSHTLTIKCTLDTLLHSQSVYYILLLFKTLIKSKIQKIIEK